MAKFKNEIKELLNVEEIAQALKKKAKYISSIEKLDGITLECALAKGKSAEAKIEEVKEICRGLKNTQVATEVNEDQDNIFLIQFPEMIPEYTDEQIEKMFKDNFSWLVENFLRNSKNLSFTKDSFISNRNIFVKQAIITYYRSNVNQYKQKPEDYLDNKEFRNKIDLIFLNYISEYKGV